LGAGVVFAAAIAAGVVGARRPLERGRRQQRRLGRRFAGDPRLELARVDEGLLVFFVGGVLSRF